jgi:hypothetical protein
MSEIDDGGSAFGQVVELRCVRVEMNGATDWEPETVLHGGLTVRDYFAAKALAAMIGQPDKDPENRGKQGVPRLAGFAYEYADAMIVARGVA